MKWDRYPLAPVRGRHSPDDVAPSDWGRWREVAWHIPRLLSGLGPLGPRGPEDGPPALVIPGFLATDRTTMELRRALARAGWRAHPWLLGMNGGAKANTMEQLASRLEAIYDGRPILLVGWSLGGMFARQLAARVPERIRAVVTLGSPFSGNLKTNTNVREIYERIAGHDVNAPPVRAARRQAPGPDPGPMVAQGRHRRPRRRPRPRDRSRQGGRDRHASYGVCGVPPGAEQGRPRNPRLPDRDGRRANR